MAEYKSQFTGEQIDNILAMGCCRINIRLQTVGENPLVRIVPVCETLYGLCTAIGTFGLHCIGTGGGVVADSMSMFELTTGDANELMVEQALFQQGSGSVSMKITVDTIYYHDLPVDADGKLNMVAGETYNIQFRDL